MPELPEAETIARGLSVHVTGAVIAGVRVHHADVVDPPLTRFRSRVRRRTIESIGRRGKNVLIRLDGGRVLVVNLGMTGRLLPYTATSRPPQPTHAAVRFDLGERGSLVFDDVRRFGLLRCLTAEEWRAWSDSLGPEPLSRRFSSRALGDALARSRAPVRSWLLDQRRVAGVGNIYANEALWRARVHPRLPASALSRRQVSRLHRGLRAVLREAVSAKGTTLRDYRTVDGDAGSFAVALAAYGREGLPCPRCRTPIVRSVFGGRSAFHCPRCQEDPE